MADQAGNRLEVVDALRGYALFGLLMVHMVERFELHWIDPQPDQWFEWVFAIFAGKSFAIFTLLFEFSFATIMTNQRARGHDFTGRFAWRIAILFIIGTLHALIYRGDILQVLAVMGLVLIPLDRIRTGRWLILIAALFFIQLPLLAQAWLAGTGHAGAQALPLFFSDTGLGVLADGSLGQVIETNLGPGMAGKWSFYLSTGRLWQIAGLFIVGMLLQRGGAFAGVDTKRTRWLMALLAMGGAWLALHYAGSQLVPAWPDNGGVPMQAQAVQWAIDSWKAALLAGFQIALFVLLWSWGGAVVLRWFALPGRMTLTLYVGQSLIMVPLLYGFGWGLWDALSTAELVAAGIGFFLLQIAFAAWWYRSFRYGPLEWVWRAATLTDASVPMRKA